MILLMVFILYNRYYENDLTKSLVKTGITLLIIVICPTMDYSFYVSVLSKV